LAAKCGPKCSWKKAMPNHIVAKGLNLFKHGYHGEPLYRRWKAMRERCNNLEGSSYSYYGGRGIVTCPSWNDYLVFRRDMEHGFDKSLTLDRIDTNGPYCPFNCRWVTRKQQCENRRPKTPSVSLDANRFITCMGRTHNLKQWALLCGISSGGLHRRLKRFRLHEALSEAVEYYILVDSRD